MVPINNRKRDDFIVQDSCLLSRTDDFIESLCDAAVLTTLDCNGRCWQVEIPENDSEIELRLPP